MKYRNIILSILFTCLMFGCKKYPENTLWLKNPNHYCPINGYITEYRVNGIDSLDLLNQYYNSNNIMTVGKKVCDEKFSAVRVAKYQFDVTCWFYRTKYEFQHTKVTWSEDKKSITTFGHYDVDSSIYFKKDILVKKTLTKWDVLYLDKKGKAKIKSTINGNTYEITFSGI